jgi:hypothetical protein
MYKVPATEKKLAPVFKFAERLELKVRFAKVVPAVIVAMVLVIPVKLQFDPEFHVAVGIEPPLTL